MYYSSSGALAGSSVLNIISISSFPENRCGSWKKQSSVDKFSGNSGVDLDFLREVNLFWRLERTTAYVTISSSG